MTTIHAIGADVDGPRLHDAMARYQSKDAVRWASKHTARWQHEVIEANAHALECACADLRPVAGALGADLDASNTGWFAPGDYVIVVGARTPRVDSLLNKATTMGAQVVNVADLVALSRAQKVMA